MLSEEDAKIKSHKKQRKTLEISLFPLLPTMNSPHNYKSNSEFFIDRRYKAKSKSPRLASSTIKTITLPKIIVKTNNKQPIRRSSSKIGKQYDSDSQLSESSDYVSMKGDNDSKTDDESIYKTSTQNRKSVNRELSSPKMIKLNTNTRVKNRIRTSFNTEHEFLERELYEIKSDFKRFRKKYLNQIKIEIGDNFNENEYLENLKEFIAEYEKKSKLKNIENDLLNKQFNGSNQTHLNYTKKFVNYKTHFETKILNLVDRLKDIYYEHISKCCRNFSIIDDDSFKLNDSNGNEIIEEELFDQTDKENGFSHSKNKSYKAIYMNVIYDYDNIVKQLNENTKLELKDISRLLAKKNSYAETFYAFIRMRFNYIALSEDIIHKNENLIKTFFEWTKQDKKFLDNLTECVEFMQRESKEIDSKRLYLQSRLSLVQKRLQKFHKDVDFLRNKQAQYRTYIEQLLKRDELIEVECDRLLYKISKINLEIKAFDEIWNTSSFSKKFEQKHQYAQSKEKKLHIVLARLHNWLESRRAEQKKIRRTIKNSNNAIELIENEVKEKEISIEPTAKEYEKYLSLNKEVDNDLSRFIAQVEQIQKARKLKLSMKSYLNLQAGLLPAQEQ